MNKKEGVRHFLRKEIEEYLVAQPLARERKNKDRAIVNTLVRRHAKFFVLIERNELTPQQLVAFVQDYNSMDRSWRKILEERPELRGLDYEDKAELEKEAQRELGYKI